ncbi:MaoC family dehydratase [Pseudomonas putida]|jgi:acyl dehydratase|uniref:MaoC family dehydratase n=1 Tax=Pseudomonas putida TaxID=303 RepID=UPI003839EB0E
MEPMITGYQRISANRYREAPGLYYEAFVVGNLFEHRPGRTVTELDNLWQSLINMNNHPSHVDAHYAQHTEFGRLLVNSSVTLAIISGMTVSTLSARAIANLGWDEIRLPNPVFAGDTLYAESEVLAKRLSVSRPGQGIVTVRVTGRNQDSLPVITYRRTFLVPCEASSQSYQIG